MRPCEQASTHSMVRPSERSPQVSAAGLEDALRRIASQIGDADRGHCCVLSDVQERLGQFGRQVGQVRSNLAGQHAGVLDRLQQEIAGLSDRIAAYGRQRQAQKGADRTALAAPSGANQAWEEPWDAQSAEALTRVCETAQAESTASRSSGRPAPARLARPTHDSPVPAQAPACAYDRAWLEGRFADIAAQLQQSLVDNNPAQPLAAIDRRLDRLDGRLDTLFSDMSVRFSGEWLELIEAHIKGLAGHFEATSRQLTRLDAVDEQLRQLSSAQAEQLRWSQAQPPALREDAIAGLIDTATERATSRLAAALPAATPAPDAEGSKRIDALERVMQDYIAERRRGEEAASGMLHTIEETLIRVLDRIDAMESGAAPFAPRTSNPPGRDGMDAESDRLAEAYAAGARILGQKPPLPTLHAADYVPPRPLPEQSPAPAAGNVGDEESSALQDLRASVMRAKLKAQATPDEPTAASPAVDDIKAETDKRESTKRSARLGRSWSNLLLGGAMLAFGTGYLAVDTLIEPDAAPALQQSPKAPAAEALPAPDPVQHPPSSEQTGKSEAVPPGQGDKTEPLRVPVPRPAGRDTNTDDPARAEPPGLPAPVPARALPGMILQENPIAANDGPPPPGSDALPPPGVGGVALRNAAANGDALAQFEVATRIAEGSGVAQDHKLAFAWYERAAMRGLAQAQFRLAAYYERGVGMAVDAERAKVWYRRAAEQGHVRAMHNLAVLIVGSGKDDADYAAAANWFQQAADRGLTDSQFNLAMLHAHGRGVAKDLAEAYKWFALAARAGDSGGARKLEEIKAQLEPSEREAGEQKLAAWRLRAAEPALNSAGR
jgi:localization factor PodJL